MPDIREGDTLQPGMPVADVLDLSELEVWAKVGELDRANLKEGQEATLQLDAIPDKRFSGKIKAMSGTASSDVFSGDPSKKFDVNFGIDMRQLLSGVGMKPADVDRIMATAAANSKKSPSGATDPFAKKPDDAAGDNAEGGGRRGGGQQRGAGGGADGQARGQGGNGGRGGFANLSEEDRKKMSDLRQKMQAASGEERDRLQKQMQDLMTKAGITPGQGRGGFGRGDGASGFGGPGGQGRGRGGAGQTGADMLAMIMSRGVNVGGYTEEDRKNAKLPLPPEQDSQVQVLLRPGLLADVEIQVEKLADVIHVPAQAVFQKNGQYLVYVRKNGKFEARPIQLVKQSESMMVISSGVEPGEIVAMADPSPDKNAKKNSEKKSQGGGGNPMGGMPGGK